MLRLIFSALALTWSPLVAACQSTLIADEDALLNGRVVDMNGAPINAKLMVGDAHYQTDARGQFALTPNPDLVYRIEIEADGYYSMRHTFSHAELMRDGDLDDLVLVAQKPGRTLFVFGGDAMIGRRFYEPFEGEPVLVTPETRLQDSKALLVEMKPYLERADYASINLETPVFETPPSEPAPKSVTFYSGPETLDALEWAGVDYVALGNNHLYDFLDPGLDMTLEHLDQSRLDFSGAGQTELEALKPYRLQQGSSEFDFLSYVGWPAGPPTQSAEANKGGAALGSLENLLSTTRASVDNAGIPVLQFHGGLEYVEEPTLAIETKLKLAVDEGAALVIGHHPHVVQGLELYQGKLIAWSLGNFLFDQYFYSAQSATLLYVWMDGDEFHHAEAVPIYIKGYHPTPAVGPMRNQINRRLYELSALRDTHLTRSGGHMILSATPISNTQTEPFDHAMDCRDGNGRQGVDLLARGDFDAAELFNAPDRSWLDLDDRMTITAKSGAPWDAGMQIDLGSDQSVMTGMRKFVRVFKPATPMAVRAEISSTADLKVDVYLQVRANGQGLEDALENGEKYLLKSTLIPADQLVEIDIDFDSPRVRARSIRVLMEITASTEAASVEIDNFELIEWNSPFSEVSDACRQNSFTSEQ